MSTIGPRFPTKGNCGLTIERDSPRVKIHAVNTIAPSGLAMFYRRISLTFLRRGALAACGMGGGARHGRSLLRCQRITVLMLYTVMNIGLPLGDFCSKSDAKAGAAQSAVANACRCSAESRQAGRCCCSKRSGASGCCSTRSTKTETRSCCAKKSLKSAASTIAVDSEPNEVPAWRSGCPCGPPEFPLLLICSQPRILTETAEFDGSANGNRWWRAASFTPCGQRPRPQVPPPEVYVV